MDSRACAQYVPPVRLVNSNLGKTDTVTLIWDFVIIGGGLAGSVSAAELSARGHKVLVLEQGHPVTDPAPVARSLARRVMAKLTNTRTHVFPGRMDQDMTVAHTTPAGRTHATTFPALLGTGPGGSSLIYGSALGRFRRTDFTDNTSADLPNNWPVAFDDFAPHYDAAEALMRVVGTPDPHDPDDSGENLIAPPPIGPRDASLADILRKNGRDPFRLHVGFDYRAGCSECLGLHCARGCKATGWSRALEPALPRDTLTLRSGASVARIEKSETNWTVIGQNADGSAFAETTAKIVMAAGALRTPAILGASPDIWPDNTPHPLLGRGLMFHAADIFAVIDPAKSPRFGPQKTLGLRDHYTDNGTPLGEIQSFGAPIATGTVANFLGEEAKRRGFGWLGPALLLARIPAAIAVRYFRHAALFATNLEDMPYAQNRVITGAPAGDIQSGIHHPAGIARPVRPPARSGERGLRTGARSVPVTHRPIPTGVTPAAPCAWGRTARHRSPIRPDSFGTIRISPSRMPPPFPRQAARTPA